MGRILQLHHPPPLPPPVNFFAMDTPLRDFTVLLREIHAAALAAVEPGRVLTTALDKDALPDRPPHILALGKAAPAMALAAIEWLAKHKVEPAGGVVLGAVPSLAPHPKLRTHHGDHPEPAKHSAQ